MVYTLSLNVSHRLTPFSQKYYRPYLRPKIKDMEEVIKRARQRRSKEEKRLIIQIYPNTNSGLPVKDYCREAEIYE